MVVVPHAGQQLVAGQDEAGTSHQLVQQVEVLSATAEACPDLLSNINNYAWALATLPDPDLRDGAKAVGLIRRAIVKLGNRDPAYLDTLAASLAESGNFDEAVRVQSEAIDILKASSVPEEIVGQFAAHLDYFLARLPLRDPASE